MRSVTAVRLFLSSGQERSVETADGAHMDEHFFIVTRSHSGAGRIETMLTLRAEDVVAAEVLSEGVRIDYVPGKGQAANKS